ncbi:MAG: radical SAM protein [Chloroflexi bacterium]|nr:radical SAM protein [Chloroflexota bacterium]MCL5075284.1 radical SAM protein [Chloroflexota bacterium]
MLRPANLTPSFYSDLIALQEGIRFLREHQPRQIWNAFKYLINLNRPLTRVTWNPVDITILIESRCNQRCRFCLWHSKDLPRPYLPYHLSFEDYRRIVDIFAERDVAHVHICAAGEIFFNKDLFKMIEYTRQKKITVSMMSNCSSVVTPYIDQIATCGINRFLTNLDSGDPQQYEHLRQRASWQTTTENIRRLVAARQRARANFRIQVDCITIRQNYHTYKNLVKVCADLGIDDLFFYYMTPYPDMNEIVVPESIIKEDEIEIVQEIDEAIALGQKLGLRVFPPKFPKKSARRVTCSNLWRKLVVNLLNEKIPPERWIGNITTNCSLAHLGEAYTLGNILQDPFEEIWNGEKIRSLRERMLTDAPQICKECPNL